MTLSQLIALRRRGLRPGLVFVHADCSPNAPPEFEDAEHVEIKANAALYRIDWRPFIGLQVLVTGVDRYRVDAVAKYIEEAGASRVVAATCGTQITDTKGHLGPQPEAVTNG